MTTSTILFLTAISGLLGPIADSPADNAPPGMVFIAGGRFDIGADEKDIKKLMEEKQNRSLASEFPPESVNVEDFFIMPTEVTNEQFAKFVAATGGEPPQLWGDTAIGLAGLEYAKKIGKEKQDAKAAGKPVPKTVQFPRAEWWKDNWQDAEWAIPEGLENHPVVFITYERAESYARWAGLRLISEAEFQIAGRGDTDWRYSWGDEFKSNFSNTIEANLGSTAPVGQFTNGAAWHDAKGKFIEKEKNRSKEGSQPIFDLSGSVWEWTRSPFVKHKGWKAIKVKLQSGQEIVSAEWDANERICVGSSFQLPSYAARLTVRRGTPRWQAADGVGMRCSASTVPGLDVAANILRSDLPTSRRPDNTVYVADRITAIDKWESEPGTSKAAGYKVISNYNCMAFLPVEDSRASGIIQLKAHSLEMPVEIGALSTTVPLLEPKLDPGTYTLSWRTAGKVEDVKKEAKEGEEDEEAEGEAKQAEEEVVVEAPEFPFDVMLDTMIFRNTEGVIVGHVVCDIPDDNRMSPGQVVVTTVSAADAAEFEITAGENINFKVFIPKKAGASKGFLFDLSVLTAPGVVDKTWRR